jgi:hypothetical protein
MDTSHTDRTTSFPPFAGSAGNSERKPKYRDSRAGPFDSSCDEIISRILEVQFNLIDHEDTTCHTIRKAMTV